MATRKRGWQDRTGDDNAREQSTMPALPIGYIKSGHSQHAPIIPHGACASFARSEALALRSKQQRSTATVPCRQQARVCAISFQADEANKALPWLTVARQDRGRRGYPGGRVGRGLGRPRCDDCGPPRLRALQCRCVYPTMHRQCMPDAPSHAAGA